MSVENGVESCKTGVPKFLAALEGEPGQSVAEVRAGEIDKDRDGNSSRLKLGRILSALREAIPGVIGIGLGANLGWKAIGQTRTIGSEDQCGGSKSRWKYTTGDICDAGWEW